MSYSESQIMRRICITQRLCQIAVFNEIGHVVEDMVRRKYSREQSVPEHAIYSVLDYLRKFPYNIHIFLLFNQSIPENSHFLSQLDTPSGFERCYLDFISPFQNQLRLSYEVGIRESIRLSAFELAEKYMHICDWLRAYQFFVPAINYSSILAHTLSAVCRAILSLWYLKVDSLFVNQTVDDQLNFMSAPNVYAILNETLCSENVLFNDLKASLSRSNACEDILNELCGESEFLPSISSNDPMMAQNESKTVEKMVVKRVNQVIEHVRLDPQAIEGGEMAAELLVTLAITGHYREAVIFTHDKLDSNSGLDGHYSSDSIRALCVMCAIVGLDDLAETRQILIHCNSTAKFLLENKILHLALKSFLDQLGSPADLIALFEHEFLPCIAFDFPHQLVQAFDRRMEYYAVFPFINSAPQNHAGWILQG